MKIQYEQKIQCSTNVRWFLFFSFSCEMQSNLNCITNTAIACLTNWYKTHLIHVFSLSNKNLQRTSEILKLELFKDVLFTLCDGTKVVPILSLTDSATFNDDLDNRLSYVLILGWMLICYIHVVQQTWF